MNYQDLCGYARTEEWAAKYKAEVDAKNAVILAERQAGLDKRVGIGVGDFVILAEDDIRRVTHDWGDSVQTTCKNADGSFYLSTDGHVSFSGSLDHAIAKDKFELTDERREGSVWFFSQNMSEAHNGYYTQATFKVWRLK